MCNTDTAQTRGRQRKREKHLQIWLNGCGAHQAVSRGRSEEDPQVGRNVSSSEQLSRKTVPMTARDRARSTGISVHLSESATKYLRFFNSTHLTVRGKFRKSAADKGRQATNMRHKKNPKRTPDPILPCACHAEAIVPSHIIVLISLSLVVQTTAIRSEHGSAALLGYC